MAVGGLLLDARAVDEVEVEVTVGVVVEESGSPLIVSRMNRCPASPETCAKSRPEAAVTSAKTHPRPGWWPGCGGRPDGAGCNAGGAVSWSSDGAQASRTSGPVPSSGACVYLGRRRFGITPSRRRAKPAFATLSSCLPRLSLA